MRKAAVCGMVLIAAAGSAQAADPLGEWREEDGKATIRIVDCNSRLWGVVASETIPGGVDRNNPDPAKQSRPTLGMPVLLNMKKSSDEQDKWEGKVYDATRGKMFSASIQLKSPNALRVEGCVAMILCGGQTWTRVGEAPPPGAKSGAAVPGAPKTTASTPATPKTTPSAMAPAAPTAAATKGAVAKSGKTAAAEPATADVCLLPEIAGAAH